MATAFERWEQTIAELAKNKAKPEDVEKARIALRQKVIEKARQEDPDNSGMALALALSRFDNGTRAQSYRSGLVKEPDVLTEDERSGVDHPVLGGIKQAAKELVATQAQGWQRIAGSALRLANDFGENEKGTWLDRAATSMEDAQKSTDEFAGEGYATADGIRGFGKMGLQNAPILISTYLTGGAVGGATSLAGRAAGLAKTAQGAAKVANAARWAGAGGAAAAGFSGEYGDARQQTLDKFKSITPEQMRESKKYAARFKAREKELYLAGAAPEDAAKQAYEETIDALSETDANIVGVVNSLIEFVAPGASKFFLGGGKLSSKSLANAKKFANLDDVKDVSRQFGQELLQEGFTSAVTDDTRAEAVNGGVNWGQVGKDALVGGTLGAIMGGGAQFSTGQSTRQRALAEIKAQEQQQVLDAQLGQAAQARKAELDAIRQQRPLTPEEQDDADVADAILARSAPPQPAGAPQQPPIQGGQPAGTPSPQPAPAPQAGAPIVGVNPPPAGAPVGSNIPQPPEPPQPAPGLSGVVQRHTQSAAPALDTVFGDAIKGNQVPDFTGLAQQTGIDRNALVDQFNAKRTDHVRKQGLMDLAEQGDLNALRSAVSGITVDPQQQDQLIKEAVAGNERRKAEALAASQQQDAQAQQQAQQAAQQQAEKDKYDQTYSKMLDEAVAALEGGQTEVKAFLPIKKKYSASGLNASDVNGVIEHAKQVIAEKQQKAARHEQAVTEAMPHLQSGDEASAVLAMEQAGVTDDADVQSVLKEANKRIRQDSKKPAGTQSVPAGQQAAPVDPLSAAVAEVKAAQAAGKKINLATIAKKHGVTILDVAKGAAAKPEQEALKAKPSQPLALPAPQGTATTGDVMVSRNGKVMSQAEADALDAAANAEKKQMRRDMAEEVGNPTGIPTGMRPKVEKPARTEQKAVLPHLILRTDGKPFPDEKQANRVLASKKLTETHEVVSVEGGKAISPKKAVTAKNQVDPEKDDILTAIAKLGGIDRAQAKSQGVDPADFSRRAGGIQFVFRKNGGKELDRMAEALSEMGYPVTENGDYTINALLDALDAALRGSAVGTPMFHEARARAMYEEEAAQREIDATFDSPGNSAEPDWLSFGADDFVSSILDGDITPNAVIASELAGIENERTIASPAAGTGQKAESGAEAGAGQGSNAPTAGPREGGQQEGKGGAGQDSGVQAGLAGNWIGADRFFETIATEEYGPAPRGEAIGFIKSSPAGTTALETVVRPSGKRVHFLLLSGGSGEYAQDFASPEKTIGSIVASLQKDIDGRKKRFDEQQRKLNDAQANEKAVAERNKYQAGVNLGDITPNTGKMLRASRIVVDNGDGTFDVEGTAGNKTARIRGMSASSIERAVKRAKGQDDFSLLGQTEAERLAEEQRQAADLEAKRKEEERARLKAQADRELSSFTLTGSDRPADVAMAAGQNDLFGPKTRGEKAAEKSQPKSDATISDADYAQVVEAAKHLKDIVYSMDNLVGDDTDLLIALSSDLGKSGRDTILMDAFGIDRSLAHTINNQLDDRKPHKLRAVDMGDAFTTFPMLRKVVDDAKDVIRKREERRSARGTESKAASQQAKAVAPEVAAVEANLEQGDAARITPEAAGDMKAGDIIKTSNGDEYVAMRSRHDFMDAHPIVDGKPVVNRDSTVRFHLNPNTASAYPDRNHAPVYMTGRNQYEEPVREMTEEGRAKDGKPIIGGDKFRTSSGRETTPYPHQKSEKYASQWLIDNATAEAEARGDDFNAPIFRRTTLRKNGTLTDADRDSMLMYLFGEQPKVVPSILKPLTEGGGKEQSDATQRKFAELSELSGRSAGAIRDAYNAKAEEDGKDAADLSIDQEILRLKLGKARKDTPANKKFDSLIATAADSPAKLQEHGIERVLDNAESRTELVRLRDYLTSLRPDKAEFIADAANDIGGDKGFDMSGVAPKPNKKQKANDQQKEEGEPLQVSPNKVFTDDAAEKARALLKKRMRGGQLNSGIDPEIMQAGITLAGYHIEKGARTFAAYAKAMMEDLGGMVRPYLKSWYMGVRYDPRASGFTGMSSAAEVDAFDINTLEETDDAQHTGISTEGSEQEREAPGGKGVVLSEQRGTEPGDGFTVQATGGEVEGDGQGGAGVSGVRPAADGKRGDQQVRGEFGQFQPADGIAGSNGREGGADAGDTRVSVDRAGAQAVVQVAEAARSDYGGLSRPQKLKAQRDAESVEVIPGDKASVDASLPFLLEGQREDVLTAERRFAAPNGHGMLFTNGTGTGKTFLALGVIKRFAKQGKNNILVVVPNDAVIREWEKSAPDLGLTIHQLADTKDAGKGISITTYANFGQNDAIAKRDYDLVVMDEAHNLMQNAQADKTAALSTLRAITLHDQGLRTLTEMQNRPLVDKISALNQQMRDNLTAMKDAPAIKKLALEKANDKIQAELTETHAKLQAAHDANVTKAEKSARPKALFLSATPFAYEKNIAWAQGYLFDWNEGRPDESQTSRRYNEPDNYEAFMVQHFGYRMRYNKLTEPDAKVDRDLMQREFNSMLKKAGSLSARMLDVPSDYQRAFALTPNSIGTKIDEGMTWLRESNDGKFRPVYDLVVQRFDYLSRQRLLEAMKAEAAIPLIQKWHALGKKVVVFYDFNEGGGFSPFNLGRISEESMEGAEGGQQEIMELVQEFYDARPDLLAINTSDLASPLDALREAFPHAGVYNGQEAKKKRAAAMDAFNDDNNPDANVLIVQSSANAGWSAHDQTGKNKRVLINLGMPTAPTKAIQQEGRIYRQGQNPDSDSMFVYLNTGTSWERIAFANTIARRASTAENLAMGEQARGLRDAFIQAFEDSDTLEPSESEGKGGKEKDRALAKVASPFDRAKTYYYGQLKKTAATKAQEGSDYFATPEPLGMKMVEWLKLDGGERALEPSAGHGAISRWLPDNTENTVVEPSYNLLSRAALNTNAKQVNGRFEDLNLVNKFDGIVMNPPFGSGGRTAIDHLEKAFKHLSDGGRIVAIIPEGPSADQKFDRWYYGTDDKGKQLNPDAVLRAVINLPAVTFERAATTVRTRIVIIDKVKNEDVRKNVPSSRDIDLSQAGDINALFDRLEGLSAPARVPTTPEQAHAEAAPEPQQGALLEPKNTTHAIKKIPLFVARMTRRVPGEEYTSLNNAAKKHGGYYSAYNKNGAIPGFQFESEANRQAFMDEVEPAKKFSASPGSGPGLTTSRAREILSADPVLSKAMPFIDIRNSKEGVPEGATPIGEEGYYHNGRITLFADNIKATPTQTAEERLKWVAFHEVTHRGVANLAESREYMAELQRAGKNPFIKNLAKKIYEKRQKLPPKYHVTMEVAIEEALAETWAALQTGSSKTIKAQYGLHFPLSIRPRAKSAIARLFEVVKRIYSKAFGRGLTNGQVAELLRKTHEAGMLPDGTNPSGRRDSLSETVSDNPTGAEQAEAQRQLEEQLAIADRMIAERGGLFAPNGERSKLNRMQWAQVRTANFKRWFGDWETDPDDKVVDDNGEPLVMYHSGNKGFTSINKSGSFGGIFLLPGGSPRHRAVEYQLFVRGEVLSLDAMQDALNGLDDGGLALYSKLLYAADEVTEDDADMITEALTDGGDYPTNDRVLELLRAIDAADAQTEIQRLRGAVARELGFGSVQTPDEHGMDTIMVTDPTQIKSATGNAGTFSPKTDDIRYSAPPTHDYSLTIAERAAIAKEWTFSVWTKTFGTQLNTAMLEPLFKPTYDLVQRYLQHTNNDAYDAISVAPNLLGRLEDINDYGREIKNIGKFSKINADREAAAVPLFEGTRFDKKVYSDAVLKRVYNLTDDQVAVYREARAAIEASLDSHAKSVITKILLDAKAVEFSDIDTLVNRDLPADDYMEELRQRLDADIVAANDAIAIQKTALSAAGITAQDKASIQASIKKGSRRVELLEEAAKRIDSTEDTLSKLKREGYFPLMRWGKYTVTVKDAGGKTVDFRMVDKLKERDALKKVLTWQYQGQGMTVTSGTMDEGRFKDFRGVSPETLALFAKELGVDNDEAYQEYLKLALPGQSALKRRIHRKGDNGEGVAGFSMDIQRTLAAFVMGNARHSARNIYGSAITKSVDAIPGEDGGVRGTARNLAEFVTQPDENSASVSIRNMLFVWNMGASVAFGALNLTQPWMMTLPWLSQFSGIGSVVELMGKASKTAAIAQKNGTVPQEYYAEYQQAVREGHVDPQNVFMLQGIERGGSGLGSSLLKTVSHGMGMIAAATESYNRKLTLFAALDVARAKGLPWLKSKGFDSAYAFAVQAVAETQGVYNKGNRMALARGPIGAILLVFKQYAVNWIEMAVRMGRNHYGDDRMRKGLMMMLGLLFAMAGGLGLPFADDLKDIAETAMGGAGKPINIERQMQMTLGKGMADAVLAGPMNSMVLNSLGLDMHGRMSMGNIIPGTGAFNPYTSTDAKLSEGISVMGAGTGLLKKGSDAVAAAQDGRIVDAVQHAAPRSVESIMKGVRMMAEGKARDSRGNVLMETTPAQAIAKMFDFQPASVAITQRERGRRFQDKNILMVARASLRNRLITAYEEKDADKIRDAEQALDEWNQDNPLYQVKLKKRDLRRAAKKRGSSWMKREETTKGLEWMDEYANQENGQ